VSRSRGLRIGIESGTLADAILMTFEQGRLIDNITHSGPRRDDLLRARSRRLRRHASLDLRRFDAYRAPTLHQASLPPATFIHRAPSRYVGLATDPDLLVAVNKALLDLQAGEP